MYDVYSVCAENKKMSAQEGKDLLFCRNLYWVLLDDEKTTFSLKGFYVKSNKQI
jgi:hypothetical protein